jgi:ABC-type transporter Mla subunit MlaD
MPRNKGHEIKVGVFVAIGLGIFALAIFALTGLGLSGGEDTYKVLFKSVAGLENGSLVRLGGLKVGRVESVGISKENARMAEAVITVKTGTPIHKDTKVQVTSVGVTGSMFLSMTLGSPDSPLLKSGATLRGEEATSFQDVINEAKGVAKRMNSVLTGLDKTANIVFEDVKKLVGDARAKVASILSTTDRAVLRFESILSVENEQNIKRFLASLGRAADRLEKNIEPAAKEFRLTLQRVRKSLGQVDRTAGAFSKLAGDSSGFVAELKRRLVSADRLMARYDRVGVGLEKVFTSGESAVAELTAALKNEIRVLREELQKEISAAGRTVRQEVGGVGDQARKTLKEGGAGLNSALSAVEGVARRVDGFLAGNQRDLKAVIVNVKVLTERLNKIVVEISGGEDGGRLTGAAEEMRLALKRAHSLMAQLDETVASHREDIQILITDLRETASNLSDFTAVIKDRPSSIILSAPAAPRTFDK